MKIQDKELGMMSDNIMEPWKLTDNRVNTYDTNKIISYHECEVT